MSLPAMQPEHYFVLAYWIVAMVASALYGWHAIKIFTKTALSDEPKHPAAWTWHQRWLNFVGALAGWLALWPLLRYFGPCLFTSCASNFGIEHAAAALVAFIGITGHLPNTVVSLVFGAGALAGKLAEVIASWVAKR